MYMEVVAKSDIFFFVTGVSVIVLTVVVLIALYYIVKILRNIFFLSKTIKNEGESIIKDISKAREGIKKRSVQLGKIISKSIAPKHKRAPTKTRKTGSSGRSKSA